MEISGPSHRSPILPIPPSKRKPEDMIEAYDEILNNVLAVATKLGAEEIVKQIRDFQKYHHGYDRQRMVPSEFNLNQAIATFGLEYDANYSFEKESVWKIEEIPETMGFEPSHCLSKGFGSLTKSIHY
jgi:hypothetical protein